MNPYYFQVTAALLKWLMESLSKCKSQECLQLYVNALQNTQNSKLAQLLFMLLEDNCHAGKRAIKIFPPSFFKCWSILILCFLYHKNTWTLGQPTENARGRKQVAIAAMKGLAAMKVDEVFDVMDKHMKLEGGVRKMFIFSS